ncbi:MAG: hypothetical protein AVDCRST_MAG19-2728, partial [uncultured Thermomicrobiales bacterium]
APFQSPRRLGTRHRRRGRPRPGHPRPRHRPGGHPAHWADHGDRDRPWSGRRGLRQRPVGPGPGPDRLRGPVHLPARRRDFRAQPPRHDRRRRRLRQLRLDPGSGNRPRRARGNLGDLDGGGPHRAGHRGDPGGGRRHLLRGRRGPHGPRRQRRADHCPLLAGADGGGAADDVGRHGHGHPDGI